MAEDYKARAKNALLKYHRRELKELAKVNAPPRERRKNSRPEKTLTVNPCLAWLRLNGFSGSLYESKAVWDTKAEKYVTKGMKSGNSDWMGCDPEGYFCAIEFKAPGKLSTLREDQHEFLSIKIQHNAFAVVVDSVKFLEQVYFNWREMPKKDKVDYLLSLLPKRKVEDFSIK